MKNLIVLMSLGLFSCGNADTILLPPVIIPNGDCGVRLHTLQASWSYSGIATGFKFYIGSVVAHEFVGGNLTGGEFEYSLDKCSCTLFQMTAVNGTYESPKSAEYGAGLGCDGQYGLIDIVE